MTGLLRRSTWTGTVPAGMDALSLRGALRPGKSSAWGAAPQTGGADRLGPSRSPSSATTSRATSPHSLRPSDLAAALDLGEARAVLEAAATVWKLGPVDASPQPSVCAAR